MSKKVTFQCYYKRMNSIYYSDNLIVEVYADISNLINVFSTTDIYATYISLSFN